MTTRPILFSAPMVLAILAGRKTQTRRTAKLNASGRVQLKGHNWHPADPDATLACPYGQPGDQLWVKETSFDCRPWKHAPLFADGPDFIYRADPDSFIGCHKWKPSIFMPRAAVRITLEITAVRIERLNSISPADCDAEGITRSACHTRDGAGRLARVRDYRTLWESINGPTSWSENPLVWAVTFTRIPS